MSAMAANNSCIGLLKTNATSSCFKNLFFVQRNIVLIGSFIQSAMYLSTDTSMPFAAKICAWKVMIKDTMERSIVSTETKPVKPGNLTVDTNTSRIRDIFFVAFEFPMKMRRSKMPKVRSMENSMAKIDVP